MMKGNFIDATRTAFKKLPQRWQTNVKIVDTSYGKLRVLDTGEAKPVILNVPDGPNVIEHQELLVNELSKYFRVICFELPGIGYSYPSFSYDYSLEKTGRLIINLMDMLKIDKAALSFSCGNGFYAIKAAEMAPHRFSHIFIAQTPSLKAMQKWTVGAIPKILRYPVVGQLANAAQEKKLANLWYRYALPKGTDITVYQEKAMHALDNGGCFCLSSIVQGLQYEVNETLRVLNTPSTLIWGCQDYTHRNTDKNTITEHLPNCEIIEFEDCAHFPELENTDKYVSILNARFNGIV